MQEYGSEVSIFRVFSGSTVSFSLSFQNHLSLQVIYCPGVSEKTVTTVPLWKGILYFLLKKSLNTDTLVGPVSISNRFSTFSKGLIIKFIKELITTKHLQNILNQGRRFRGRHIRSIQNNF